MNFNPRAVLRRIVLAMAAGVLGAAAVALGLLALYIYAAAMLNPMLAAVVTAGGALTLGGLLMLGGRCCRVVRHASRRRRHYSDDPQELANSLEHLLHKNAKKITIAALVAGVALGASPKLRHSLARMLRDKD